MSTKIIQTAAEKSVKVLVGSVNNSAKVIAELLTVAETLPELLEKVAEAEVKLAGITDETKSKARNAKIELEFLIRENESDVLTTLLEKNDLANIGHADLATVYAKLETAQGDNASEVSKAVAIASAKVKAEGELKLAQTVSANAVDVAKKDADLTAANREIEFLTRQVNQLETTITQEREARIEMAKAAASAAGVVVNTSAK